MNHRTTHKDLRKLHYKEFPEEYSNAMRTVALRCAESLLSTSRHLRWSLEETALAVNEKVSPETLTLFELVDDSQFNFLSNDGKDGDPQFFSVLLRESIRESSLPKFILMAASIYTSSESRLEYTMRKLCANLKFAYDENKKQGIVTKTRGIMSQFGTWHLVTYEGDRILDDSTNVDYREEKKFDLECFYFCDDLLDVEGWNKWNSNFVGGFFSLFELAFKEFTQAMPK